MRPSKEETRKQFANVSLEPNMFRYIPLECPGRFVLFALWAPGKKSELLGSSPAEHRRKLPPLPFSGGVCLLSAPATRTQSHFHKFPQVLRQLVPYNSRQTLFYFHAPARRPAPAGSSSRTAPPPLLAPPFIFPLPSTPRPPPPALSLSFSSLSSSLDSRRFYGGAR